MNNGSARSKYYGEQQEFLVFVRGVHFGDTVIKVPRALHSHFLLKKTLPLVHLLQTLGSIGCTDVKSDVICVLPHLILIFCLPLLSRLPIALHECALIKSVCSMCSGESKKGLKHSAHRQLF